MVNFIQEDSLDMKRNIIWGLGFVVLFLINAIVELILLPLWGLDNTPKNDIYFKGWWVIVVIWLLFGRIFLKFVGKSHT